MKIEAKFFSFQGIPAIIRKPAMVPEVWVGGEWAPYYNTEKFVHEADSMGVQDWIALIKENDAGVPDEEKNVSPAPPKTKPSPFKRS